MAPTEIDRAAPAVVRIERVIAAAPERVWQLQVDVAGWPSWQKDVEASTIEGLFAMGNAFTWTAAGLAEPIVSTIYSVDAKCSILWGGPPRMSTTLSINRLPESAPLRRGLVP